MTKIGYARVSTVEQDPHPVALQRAGCTVIREEKASATSTAGRTELAIVLAFLQRGDTLCVTRIDRLGQVDEGSPRHCPRPARQGHRVQCTEQPVDTSTAAGKCFLDMLGVFAEFETNLRRERQLEGIAQAKAEVCIYRAQGIDRRRMQSVPCVQKASVGPR